MRFLARRPRRRFRTAATACRRPASPLMADGALSARHTGKSEERRQRWREAVAVKGPGLRGSIKAQRAGRTTQQQSSTHSYSRSLSSLLPLRTLSCTTHSEHHVLPRRRPLYPCLRRPCGRRQQLQHRPRSVLQQAREGTSQTSSLISCAGLPWLTWTKFTGGLCCRRGDPVRSRRGCPGRDGEDRVGVLAYLRGRGRER